MANNYIGPGDIRDWTNGTGSTKVAGTVVVVGQQLGVTLVDIANGATGSVAFEGRFNVPKVSGAVIAHGEKVIWDVSAAAFDDNLATPAAGDVSNAAVAAEAAGDGVTDIDIVLSNLAGSVT